MLKKRKLQNSCNASFLSISNDVTKPKSKINRIGPSIVIPSRKSKSNPLIMKNIQSYFSKTSCATSSSSTTLSSSSSAAADYHAEKYYRMRFQNIATNRTPKSDMMIDSCLAYSDTLTPINNHLCFHDENIMPQSNVMMPPELSEFSPALAFPGHDNQTIEDIIPECGKCHFLPLQKDINDMQDIQSFTRCGICHIYYCRDCHVDSMYTCSHCGEKECEMCIGFDDSQGSNFATRDDCFLHDYCSLCLHNKVDGGTRIFLCSKCQS